MRTSPSCLARWHRSGGADSGVDHGGRDQRANGGDAKDGRRIRMGIYEAALVRARTTQADPVWRGEYPAPRQKVERKIAHLMRRRHGGRRARARGQSKVAADFSLLAAAVNLIGRFGILGLTRVSGPRWVL